MTPEAAPQPSPTNNIESIIESPRLPRRSTRICKVPDKLNLWQYWFSLFWNKLPIYLSRGWMLWKCWVNYKTLLCCDFNMLCFSLYFKHLEKWCLKRLYSNIHAYSFATYSKLIRIGYDIEIPPLLQNQHGFFKK